MADPAPSSRWWFLFAAALLLIGAAFLRLQQIDRRILHADEGVQAYQTWQLLRGEGYTYDPADKHGPFLYYAATSIATVAGWSPASLNGIQLRTVTLLAGLGTLALLLGAASQLGRRTVLVGAALLAAAPLAIIYDTYFVQEAWFCFFTWALFFAVMRWWGDVSPDQPVGASLLATVDSREQVRSHKFRSNLGAAVLIGALAGLMQATKETSVLHFAALGVALVVVRWSGGSAAGRGRRTPPSPAGQAGSGDPVPPFRSVARYALIAFVAATFVYVLFYSSFFTRSAGVLDGVRAYYNYALRATAAAHQQPWHYYISMLWPHASGGVRWGEPLLILTALVGLIPAFSARSNSTHRALAVFTLALLFIYSMISYKTPWLLLTPYVGVVLLAGLGVRHVAQRLPKIIGPIAAGVLGLLLLLECAWNDRQALGRYANDERNPYVYQPAAPDLLRLITVLRALPAHWKIAVISPDHAWPLPWYLRERPAVGYFTTAPAGLTGYDFVLIDSRLDTSKPPAEGIYGLRPNVFLWPAPPP